MEAHWRALLLLALLLGTCEGSIDAAECSRSFHNVVNSKNSSSSCSWSLQDGLTRMRRRSSDDKTRLEEDIGDLSDSHILDKIDRYFRFPYIFNAKNANGLSKACQDQIREYSIATKDLKLWAMKLYDSSARLPSGLLNGNVNQYGDFDQCLSIKTKVKSVKNRPDIIKGQYCLSSIQLSLKENATGEMITLYDLAHSHHAIRSRLTDPGHRIPRFSSITWGICTPHMCGAEDLQTLFVKNLRNSTNLNRTFNFDVLVDPHMCQIKNEANLSTGTVLTIIFFLVIIGMAVYATIVDGGQHPSNEIVMSFSLKRTFKTLLSSNRSDDDIEAVHGVRFVNAILLIIAHKSMALFYYPFANRTELAKDLGQSWSIVGRAASLYTDPFIMFSGMLTCYSILGNLKKNKEVNVFQEYLNRLFRLIPTLTALILFCTWILPNLGSGPQWPLVINYHADNCKKYWWRNFLFVHNYYGFEKMCLTHTHHIGIDTQLFILGVPVLIWMGKNLGHKNRILICFNLLASISTVARFYISYKMRLVNFVNYGATVQKMLETTDFMYILPVYRFTVYAMGVILGYVLRYPPVLKLTKNHLTVGWLLSAASLYASFFWPMEMSHMKYEYDPLHNALFASLAPIGWCFSFAWVIYTTHHGYNSRIGRLLSWRGFLVWTRISYAVYLTQFPIFFYFIGVARVPMHYNLIGSYINLNELLCVVVFSVAMTLLFDLPFQRIKSVLFRRKEERSVTYKS